MSNLESNVAAANDDLDAFIEDWKLMKARGASDEDALFEITGTIHYDYPQVEDMARVLAVAIRRLAGIASSNQLTSRYIDG